MICHSINRFVCFFSVNVDSDKKKNADNVPLLKRFSGIQQNKMSIKKVKSAGNIKFPES